MELKIGNVGKGGCRKILTVNVADCGKGGVNKLRFFWNMMVGQEWSLKMFEQNSGNQHLGISISL